MLPTFRDYSYEIAFWVTRGFDPDRDEQVRQDVGRQIFEALKRINKYPVRPIDDVQTKLDEYRSATDGQLC